MKRSPLTIAIFALLLASCSQSTITEIEAEKPDICNILEPTVMQELLGESYSSGPLIDMLEGADGCKYIAQTDPPEEAKIFNFILRTSKSEEQSEDEYLRAINFWVNNELSYRKYEHIEDVGTKAFLAYAQKSPQLITYKDKNLLIITFANFNEDSETILPKLKSTAQKLLEDL